PLAPGLYEIIEMTPGWTGTFTVGKDVSYGYAMVNITAGKTTTVKVVNEPTGTPMSGPLAIWKAIITADDDFIFGDGFEFAAFEEDGVTPVLDEDGNPVTGISSGDEMGMVFFPSVFDVNKNYIIKEITVSPEYVWGPENPDGFILFEGNGFFFTPVDSSGFFYNVEVSKGDLGISASVAEKYVVKKYVPQFEPIYEEKWKPIFEWQDIYRTDGYNSTIVSSVNNGVLDADKGVTGGFINRTNGGYNGFTYLEIDVALLAEQGDAGFNVNLAQSNMSNGNSPNSSWNTPLSGVYNVKIVDGQLVVTCDLVSGSFGVLVADKEFTYNPTSDIKHDNNGNLGEVDGIVYLFFHMSGNAKWQVFVETKKVYIGKEFLGEKLVDVKFDKWVLDSVSEPKIRNSGASLEVLVTDADGGFVYQGEPTALTDLTAGDYEVSLIINGDVVDSQKVTVIAGDKVSADFDPFYLWGDPVIKKLPKSLWSVPDFPEWVNVP
ncbi:MAG: hypothetical protein FWF40_03695, partial [Methanomassiliicoccaceae archaeon]|nr:hypothetical protein [Methanomassiliicoccaceae archaeon]